MPPAPETAAVRATADPPRGIRYTGFGRALRRMEATIWIALGATALGPGWLAGQEDPLRGGRFEVGVLGGPGSFQSKSGIESCRWVGVRIGHRFAPFPGNERLRVGFRTGWEGCLTEHPSIGRIDVIHVHAGLYFGVQPARSWLIYWLTGAGELLADSTPGPGDDVEPRFALHGGPGVTWALSDRFVLDASLLGMVFEGYDLSGPGGEGSTWGLVPNLMLAIQI